ncbi:MAG: sulfurtransferase [Flavobacteriaceae bacterium]|nr:sulfurtransferase [Flavobacteriaceae bacterium]
MNWRIKIGCIAVLFFACNGEEKKWGEDTPFVSEATKAYYSTEHLIEVEELKNSSTSIDHKIIDLRKPDDFNSGHIPNAINIWRTDIENNDYPYQGIMATKAQIELLFSKLGIENKDHLIIYDNNGACDASRLWWILKNYGFENVKLLNGGLDHWIEMKGKLSKETQVYQPSQFTLPDELNIELYIGLNELKSVVTNNSSVVLDTRATDEFTGLRQKSGASRAGHIPKSIMVDWANTIDYHGSKKFKSFQELYDLYARHQITQDKDIIVYCHSGVRSSHTTFVLTELLGFKRVKNYDGSWVEWSYHKELPIESDTITKEYK